MQCYISTHNQKAMTTPEIKAQVDSLILKAEEHNLVQSVKQIFKVLGAAGMMYDLKIPPMLIGCHPSNRDGYGINPNDVHRLISDIFTLGFDHGEVKAVCSEIDPAEAAKVQAWNDKMIQESAGKLAPLECDLRYATLWGGHTNQCLRAVAAGLVHEDERLVAGGKLNLQKIAATDPIFAEAAVGGAQWQVLSHKVFQI